MRTKLRHLPARTAAGAYILSSGLDGLQADDDRAKRTQVMAAEAYPQLGQVDPQTVTRAVAVGEVALGVALLVPLVPSSIAGLGLGAFAGAMLGVYLRAPGLRRAESMRPSADGVALAKDVWLLGIAGTLILDRDAWSKRRKRRRSGPGLGVAGPEGRRHDRPTRQGRPLGGR